MPLPSRNALRTTALTLALTAAAVIVAVALAAVVVIVGLSTGGGAPEPIARTAPDRPAMEPLRAGTTAVYDDGLRVTVSAARAAPGTADAPGAEFVTCTVTVRYVNRGDAAAALLENDRRWVHLRAGEGDHVNTRAAGSPPRRKLAPGGTATLRVEFSAQPSYGALVLQPSVADQGSGRTSALWNVPLCHGDPT